MPKKLALETLNLDDTLALDGFDDTAIDNADLDIDDYYGSH